MPETVNDTFVLESFTCVFSPNLTPGLCQTCVCEYNVSPSVDVLLSHFLPFSLFLPPSFFTIFIPFSPSSATVLSIVLTLLMLSALRTIPNCLGVGGEEGELEGKQSTRAERKARHILVVC